MEYDHDEDEHLCFYCEVVIYRGTRAKFTEDAKAKHYVGGEGNDE